MPVSCTSMSVTPKNGTPCNLKFPWRRPCRCLALGDGENVKPEVGADSVGATTERAFAHPSTALALARTYTMKYLDVASNPKANRQMLVRSASASDQNRSALVFRLQC